MLADYALCIIISDAGWPGLLTQLSQSLLWLFPGVYAIAAASRRFVRHSTSACMLLAALVSRVGALAPRIVAPAKRRVVRSMASTGLTDHEKFLFDLNGYLVVRGALSADEIGELNAAIDAHSHEAISRDATALKNAKRAGYFGAKGSRRDLGGMLNWEEDGFRKLLAHPKLAPYCDALLAVWNSDFTARSSRRPARHRRDACSMAWRCRFLTTRRSQHGRVIAVK